MLIEFSTECAGENFQYLAKISTKICGLLFGTLCKIVSKAVVYATGDRVCEI